MFSIVIPLYNKELSITNTLQSVLNQTFTTFEVVIVNDGSTDTSVDKVKAFNDTRIRIIEQENGGVSSARNTGIKEAKYNYVAFIDGDDLWKSNYLSTMVQLITDFPNAKFYASNYSVLKNEKLFDYTNYLEEGFRGYIDNYFTVALQSKLFQTSATIISKKISESFLLFNEELSIGEDFDYWYRNILNSKIAFVNQPLTIYNMDDDNMVSNKKNSFNKKYNYLFVISSYAHLDKNLRKLNNTIKIGKIPDVILNHSKEDFFQFIESIDFSIVSLKYKIFSYLPYVMKRMVIKILYK
ncbi:glycosyltransferase family A protein [uncultured Tenacibaculum sp.]|uniref:glycosyltransferase family 2 protein n=1 Tax=uncultured Tenacibaculum sp. TaxID=174713 RepID=UPI0026226D07|nr:glycosyltransferase family A protein [uncultured Tenacibaculum sp.]